MQPGFRLGSTPWYSTCLTVLLATNDAALWVFMSFCRISFMVRATRFGFLSSAAKISFAPLPGGKRRLPSTEIISSSSASWLELLELNLDILLVWDLCDV
eukprot:Skav215274  [mRNA]  locus=scaffold2881:233081:234984:+ [translate_table: standard]